MSSLEFEKRQSAQIKKIEIDKWLEGIRIQGDPGQSYVLWWIKENSEKFSLQWRSSLCKSCSRALECGFNIVIECSRHVPEDNGLDRS